MSTPLQTSSPEALLEHAGWMRRLARTLVAEPGAAEDLVQETWLAALRRPPKDQTALRPWLTRTLRNAARMGYRGNAARKARERSGARDEALPGVDEHAQCIEGQRLLAEAVHKLREPYRKTVWQRYYEGLAPAEIAEREGVPASSVRRRLSVALEELRGDLDRKYDGDRGAWCLALAPLAGARSAMSVAGTALVPVALGTLAMKALLICLTAGLLVLGLSALAADDVPETRTAALPAPEQNDVPQPDALELPEAQPEGRTPSGLTGNDSHGSTAHPEPPVVAPKFSLSGRVLDVKGHAIAGAQLTLTGGARQQVLSQPDGRFLMSIGKSNVSELPSRGLEISASGYVTRRLELVNVLGERAPEEGDHSLGDWVLDPAGTLTGRILDLDGLPLARADVVARQYQAGVVPSTELRYRLREVYGPDQVQTGGDGAFRIDHLKPGLWVLQAKGKGYLIGSSDPVEITAEDPVFDIELKLERVPDSCIIEGTVLTEDGAPSAYTEITASLRTLENSSSDHGETDEDGHFRFEMVTTEPVLVVAWSDDRTERAVQAEVVGGDRDLRLVLSATPMAQVLVRDEGGAAVEDYSLIAYTSFDLSAGSRSGKGVDLEWDRATGLGSFPMPAKPFLLSVDSGEFQEAIAGPYDPARLNEPIEVTLEARPVLEGRVLFAGEPVSGAEVSLLRHFPSSTRMVVNGLLGRSKVDTTARPVRTDEDGRFSLPADLEPRPADRGSAPRFSVLAKSLSAGGATESTIFGTDGPGGALELDLEPFGSMGGDVRARGSVELLAATLGDGEIAVTRVDPEGGFLFKDLRPGTWRVRPYHEDLQDSTSSLSIADDVELGRAWECVVASGEQTSLSIDLSEERTVLQVDVPLDPSLKWVARLQPKRGHDTIARAFLDTIPVTPGAPIELSALAQGAHVLMLEGSDEGGRAQLIRAEVDLEGGVQGWRRDWEATAWTWSPSAPLDLGTDLLWHSHDAGGGTKVHTKLKPGSDGQSSTLRARVPSGQGSVHRLPAYGTPGFHTGENLGAVEVMPGK